MSPPVDRVTPSANLPAAADVVVIGGGIAGVSTALALLRKGHSVVLCEKGRIAGEQSSRNWGWCRAMGRDSREIPLIQESLRIWKGLDRVVEADVGFRQCGILYLCENEAEMQGYEPWLEHARRHQIGSRLISADETRKVMPGLERRIAGALYTPTDGRAEPAIAAPAIARAVQALGGTVMTDCAVRTVETAAGRVSGVVTEKGPVACQAVVLAGGAWSRLFCGNLGLSLPQLKVLGSVLRTHRLDGAPETSAAGSDFAFRKRADGGYSVAHGGLSTAEITPDSFRLFGAFLPAFLKEWRSVRLHLGRQFVDEWRWKRRWNAEEATPFEAVRVLDPAPNHRLLDTALASLRKAHPAFAGAVEAQRWGGLIDVTPDAVPVISDVAAVPGFFLATGFSGHGFGIGPGAGRLMADLVAGDDPVVDPAPFRFSRFSDGSRVTVEAGF
ncbi:NAD(P)/FAD-dependent oxidoreductase [Labrys monachus]|uniref:Glycine/D-amino acid oxidase-like deaminating enzyme n=1 Tax=Labrys monachus TaxID=217067 RepID=A0ABU0FKJ6_9HYPH|nr:FAD-binding oxidoreductase [Labrys monachus]MDQ0394608.1 glycine/D-amino acid oxidase-like deaminating enzyme [Labrys monachus]